MEGRGVHFVAELCLLQKDIDSLFFHTGGLSSVDQGVDASLYYDEHYIAGNIFYECVIELIGNVLWDTFPPV